MRRLSVLFIIPALLTAGCRYRLMPESRICEDLAYAVSERTYVCQDDAELAGERHAVFTDEVECLLPDEVEDPYNPDGILPADDNPEEQARLEGLYDCVRAVRQADCDAVAADGDDPAFWVGLHAACAEIVGVEGAAASGDTGGDTGASP
jgi:hypothetical protein